MENKTIELKSGKKVALRHLLTGRDIEYIEAPMTDIKVSLNDKGKVNTELNAGEAKTESLHRAIEKVVVSIDGVEAKVDDVLNLPVADYREVVTAVDKIITGEDF